MSIDLRKEFSELIKDYGHDILLQRSDKKMRCRCWNAKYLEASSDCPYCLGAGYVSRIERHTVMRKNATQVVSRPNLLQQTEVGKMWVDAIHYYLSYYTNPQAGDYIYEVGWAGDKPSAVLHCYRINDVYAYRGDRGRIEYWGVAVKSEPSQMPVATPVVRKIGAIKNYEWRFSKKGRV